jgi:4-alpha-glucanotransferase
MRRALELADLFRIDHFRGFAAYWAVPAGARSARSGAWRPGPGRAVFDAARADLGDLPVVAEDLGLITPDVRALRDELGFPGMAVTIWAFSGGRTNPHRLENHRAHQVVYTSTHDTETLAGAFGEDEAWRLVELTLSSVAELAIVPAQDVLGLGNETRMNRPGTTQGNWTWRLEPGQLTGAHAKRFRAAAVAGGRAAA